MNDLKRYFLLPALTAVLFVFCACTKKMPDEVKQALQQDNPAWAGDFATGHYSLETPVFEFDDNPEFNAIALSGGNLTDFSALESLTLRILSLADLDITSLDFMKELDWEADAIIEIRDCPKITNFKAVSTIPLSTVYFQNLPFSDTRDLCDKLVSVYLDQTQVKKLDFQNPVAIEELFLVTPGTIREPDISQISQMTRLVSLTLKNVDSISQVDFSRLGFLENLTLSSSKITQFPELAPAVLRAVWLEECPNITDLSCLSGKVIERLCIMRSGDPGKLLENLTNAKIDLLVINGTHVSDLSFLKRIKGLNCVRFQNCTGLPEKLQDDYIEIIVEEI